MSDYKRTNHTEWDCKYHIIFIPKYRKKVLYGKLRDRLGGVFRRLAHQKESEVEEGHLRVDHVHMMLSIPPKYSVATVVGFLKGDPPPKPGGGSHSLRRLRAGVDDYCCISGEHQRFTLAMASGQVR